MDDLSLQNVDAFVSKHYRIDAIYAVVAASYDGTDKVSLTFNLNAGIIDGSDNLIVIKATTPNVVFQRLVVWNDAVWKPQSGEWLHSYYCKIVELDGRSRECKVYDLTKVT